MNFFRVSTFTTLASGLLSAGCSHRDPALSTAPTNIVSTPTGAGAGTSAEAGTPKSVEPSLFYLAAESGKPFQVYVLDNVTFVHSGSFVGQLEKDKIVYDATILRGLGLTGEDMGIAFLERIFGSWPSEAWALQRGSTGRVGYSNALRWASRARVPSSFATLHVPLASSSSTLRRRSSKPRLRSGSANRPKGGASAGAG